MSRTTTSELLLLALGVLVLAGCGAATGTSSASKTSNGDSAAPADESAEPAGKVAELSGEATAPADDEADPLAAQAEQVSESSSDAATKQQPATVRGTGEIEEITFEDLKCGIQADVVFRPWMLTERAKELDGRRIRVIGFMLPDTKQIGISYFVLLRNTECKFGPGGQADHLIQVKLQDGVTAEYKGERPVEVVGTLQINPFEGPDGNTWCIYDLAGESVEWKRR